MTPAVRISSQKLRIIDDETWKAVRDRYASVQRKWSATAKASFNQFRRPKYLFSGLTKCGECGAGFIVHSRELLGCFGARDRGTCTNTLRISRLDVESRVLGALQTKLLRKDFFEEFCREFAKETNRLRMEQRASLNVANRRHTCSPSGRPRARTSSAALLSPRTGNLVAASRSFSRAARP